MNDNFLKNFESFFNDIELHRPIPTNLYSVYLEGPFQNCVGCEEHLLTTPKLYEIQKVFKGKEVIFEYALCFACGENLLKEYSQQSMNALQNYILEHFCPMVQQGHCQLCNGIVDREYVINALCKGNGLIEMFMICQRCMEKLDSLLSQKTREAMQHFIETKFPGVPAEFYPIPILKI